MHALELFLTIFGSVAASSGFWSFWARKADNRAAVDRLIRGLAHDRIIHVGKGYIQRGWITWDEYEDWITYLTKPYTELGGNGIAERIMNAVDQLPVRHTGEESNATRKQDVRRSEVDRPDSCPGDGNPVCCSRRDLGSSPR